MHKYWGFGLAASVIVAAAVDPPTAATYDVDPLDFAQKAVTWVTSATATGFMAEGIVDFEPKLTIVGGHVLEHPVNSWLPV